MESVTVLQPTSNAAIDPQQPLHVAGRAIGRGMPEPSEADEVTVSVDGGSPVQADLTIVPHQAAPTKLFDASVQVPPDAGPHAITVTATFDSGVTKRASVLVLVSTATKLVITPTFTDNFNANFGGNAAAAQAAWLAAAQVFATNFSDPIHVNITVDAVAGTNVFGESHLSLLSISYADLLAKVTAKAVTQNDLIAIGPGGSMTACDPTNGAGNWVLTRAQAKAFGQIPDDLSEDGITVFGAGNPFTFSGPITAGTFDFQGIAAHEISEVMGRLGLSGGTVGTTANSFSLIDNFSYTGPGTKGLRGGPGNNFSIDNGITLLKLFNDPTVNELDSRDWAPGTNDAFNQFSDSGVVNPVSLVDLQLMDVIGYTLVTPSLVAAAAVHRASGIVRPRWNGKA
jgi:hypothetical protein